jgi:hypothetical protein
MADVSALVSENSRQLLGFGHIAALGQQDDGSEDAEDDRLADVFAETQARDPLVPACGLIHEVLQSVRRFEALAAHLADLHGTEDEPPQEERAPDEKGHEEDTEPLLRTCVGYR